MATNIPNDQLYAYADRVKGQTVLITGAANGIGKATALEFAKRGAKVVIGDIDIRGAGETVAEIQKSGGEAVCVRCDVCQWEDQVSLFELAIAKFGAIDIVVPNAGVSEIGVFSKTNVDSNGRPVKPNLKTTEVNLTSVLYSTHLAVYYLQQNQKPDSLKALVLIGSMASISGLTGAPLYSASKHGILGFARALYPELQQYGLRVVTIAPWFADTAIIPRATKVLMGGIPMVPISRIAGAVFLAATDGAPGTNGAVYSIPDEREVFRIPHVALNEGVYELINNRAKRVFGFVDNIKITIGFLRVLLDSTAVKLLAFGLSGMLGAKIAIEKGYI